MKTFDGKLSDCLSYFLATNAEDPREIGYFIHFLKNTNKKQLENWQIGKTRPHGLTTLKVFFYLESLGYTIKEISLLPQNVRYMIALLALEIIGLEQAKKETGFKYDKGLLSVLTGKNNTSEKTLDKMGVIVVAFRQRLEEETNIWKGKRLLFQSPEPSQQEKILNALSPGNNDMTVDLLRVIDSGSKTLEVFLKQYLEAPSPETRQKLRDRLEKEGRSIFQLSNSVYRLYQYLGALCSEESLAKYKNHK